MKKEETAFYLGPKGVKKEGTALYLGPKGVKKEGHALSYSLSLRSGERRIWTR